MKTHTPGPWMVEGYNPETALCEVVTVERGIEFIDRGNTLAKVYCYPDGIDPIRDARLMATAPDLLAALEGLFEHCAMIHKNWGEGCNNREAEDSISFARAAIRKARGGEA